MTKPMRLFVLLPVLLPVSLAAEQLPQLPGVPYTVHDLSRPQPPAVETGGAVAIRPPSDATVLFDGSSVDAWEGKVPWKIVDGAMVATGGDTQTKESFGPVQFHIEWRVPAGRKVEGQAGGNSGVFFLGGAYEVQILQSHQNPTYPDGQAGAIYAQLPPRVNATAPQGEWQSYDITFEPPVYEGKKVVQPTKVTVIHNGVVVQHGEQLLGISGHKRGPAYPESHPETGPIRLQFHGDPIEFRNIWVRPLNKIDQAR